MLTISFFFCCCCEQLFVFFCELLFTCIMIFVFSVFALIHFLNASNNFKAKHAVTRVLYWRVNLLVFWVFFSTEEERYEAFEAMRRLSESLGDTWKENTINICKLKPSDIEEFAALLQSELEVKNMWTVRTKSWLVTSKKSSLKKFVYKIILC